MINCKVDICNNVNSFDKACGEIIWQLMHLNVYYIQIQSWSDSILDTQLAPVFLMNYVIKKCPYQFLRNNMNTDRTMYMSVWFFISFYNKKELKDFLVKWIRKLYKTLQWTLQHKWDFSKIVPCHKW